MQSAQFTADDMAIIREALYDLHAKYHQRATTEDNAEVRQIYQDIADKIGATLTYAHSIYVDGE